MRKFAFMILAAVLWMAASWSLADPDWQPLSPDRMSLVRGESIKHRQLGYIDCSEHMNLQAGTVPETLCVDPAFNGSSCAKCAGDPISPNVGPYTTGPKLFHVEEIECSGELQFGTCVQPPDGAGYCATTVISDNCDGYLDIWD